MVIVTLAAAPAAAHVAPSVDDNNRYLKLTPLGDRVRFAYTVFFGEVPGAGERSSIDANHDGQITDAEAHGFGEKLAAEVGAQIDLEIDGHGQPVKWTIIDVGMGTSTVNAGSFSVDLVAWLCLPTVRGTHRITLRDHFRIPHAGETEVKVEDSPGVTITSAHVGPADDPSYDFRFVGLGGPLADDGLALAFTAGDKATVTADGACTAATTSPPGSRQKIIAYSIGGFVVLMTIVGFILRRIRLR
ncbi:MAG: hypothetical protein JWO36_5031 [Myxococcales bacterium]|nr:hypothetical protein [Myxococcales bacterium]